MDEENQQNNLNNQPLPNNNGGYTPPPNKYEGPVAQTDLNPSEYSESYNSSNQVVHKSHKKQWEILIFAVILIAIIVVAVIFLGGSDENNTTQQNSISQNESSAQEEENTNNQTVEEQVAAQAPESDDKEEVNQSVIAAQSKERDTERKTDINTMYLKLEVYFNENGYYPTEQFSANLFPDTDPEAFLDPNNVRISQLGKLSTEMPVSPFTPGTEPTGSQYSYIAYQCTSPLPGEGKCNKYLLSAWLETENEIYQKASLN